MIDPVRRSCGVYALGLVLTGEVGAQSLSCSRNRSTRVRQGRADRAVPHVEHALDRSSSFVTVYVSRTRSSVASCSHESVSAQYAQCKSSTPFRCQNVEDGLCQSVAPFESMRLIVDSASGPENLQSTSTPTYGVHSTRSYPFISIRDRELDQTSKTQKKL